MTEHVTSALEDGVLQLTINRPEKRNALTQEMYGALADGIARAEDEKGVRVVHITGAGDIFTAGNDIADFKGGTPAEGETPVIRFVRAIAGTEVPIVAAVNGAAVGIGTTMLLHVDFVYAAPEATFVTPFIDLGVVPEAASSLIMPSQMGHKKAASMLMLGDKFSAEQMREAGIVTEVVEGSGLLTKSLDIARRLAHKPSGSLRTTKRLMRLDAGARTERLELEFHEFGIALKSPEAQEAMTAFIQKRKPDFTKFD